MATKQPRKQRKALHNAPLHRKHRVMSAHLSAELSARYGRRSLPVVKGDTVAVMRGDSKYRGHVGKVDKVVVQHFYITIDGVTVAKADNTQKAKRVHPSNVVITRLNLDDPLRKGRLKEVPGAAPAEAEPKKKEDEKKEEK